MFRPFPNLKQTFAGLLLGAAFAAQAAPPAPDWTLQTLGPAVRGDFASGLNNRGDVVGSTVTEISTGFGPNVAHAFLWQNGAMQDLGSPMGGMSSAYLAAINDQGMAVGASAQVVHTWRDGTWTSLGFNGEPADINKSGAIVGSTFGRTGYRGWIYRDGVLQELPTFGGTSGFATAINDRGLVAGSASYANGQTHAMTWDNGTMTDLGTLGGTFSRATDINNHGVVVGQSSTATANSVAFIYDRSGMRPLIEASTNAFPAAINDRGDVVGTLDNNSASFVIKDGRFTRLEDLPAVRAAGFTRIYPEDINERGWITGSGLRNGKNEAILLIPR